MSKNAARATGKVDPTAADNGLRAWRPAACAISLAALLPLGGCSGLNKVYAPPEVAYDYRDRHPIVLAEAQTTVDVFPPPMGAHLDKESVLRIREFVARYRKLGKGMITVLAPIGDPDPKGAQKGLAQVRRALAQAGVGNAVYVGGYPVTDPGLAAPIRLSFTGVKAKVAGRCGEWPDDLASGGSLEGWQNHSFWNFGCASQMTLSAQIADPRDLADPRGETPQDIETRMRAIGKVRNGVDPSTTWQTKNGSISGVGG
jgi:pilus assembly protein CpaD